MKQNKFIFLLCAILIHSPLLQAKENVSCESAYKKAVEQEKKENSFKAIFDFYKNFSHCDDAAYAEGISGLVVTSLDKNWNKLDALNVLLKDLNFKKFYFSHFDALVTSTETQMRSIISKAKNSCPKKYSKLCAEIQKNAQVSLDHAENY